MMRSPHNGKLWKQYCDEVQYSIDALPQGGNEPFTPERLSVLPGLLQRHIVNGGYLATPMMEHMLIRFHHASFRLSAEKRPIQVRFMQVNFAKRPDRHAFLSARIAGISLQAKDSVLDGTGSMTGMLAKHFTLFRSTGAEMDQSQLITALADAVFMPSLFLQSFVSWRAVDGRTVEGMITWKGISAKGQFTFDPCGNIARFETNDRYMDENGKGGSLVPWFVDYSGYQKQNGYLQPGSVRVNWALPGGDNTYFASDQIEICYTIEHFNR